MQRVRRRSTVGVAVLVAMIATSCLVGPVTGPGDISLRAGFDVGEVGYERSEFFLGDRANSYSSADPLSGLRPGGWVVVNTPDPPEALGIDPGFQVATVDASQIALRHGLGSAAQPVVNTAILGAFVRATGIVTLDDLLAAIAHEVPNKVEENQVAASEAHDRVALQVAV